MDWKWKYVHFNDLQVSELYNLLRLRQEVFVIEQNCLYNDLDNLDQVAWHLMSLGEYNEIAAYLRILPPNTKYKEVSIGRVITHVKYRRLGLGKQLFKEGIQRVQEQYKTSLIRIAAQSYLQKFYESFGFQQVSTEYIDDGIPHIEMLLQK